MLCCQMSVFSNTRNPKDWHLYLFCPLHVLGQWNGANLIGRTQEMFAGGANTPKVWPPPRIDEETEV